jgi:N-acyl-D-amino-acid deacylase
MGLQIRKARDFLKSPMGFSAWSFYLALLIAAGTLVSNSKGIRNLLAANAAQDVGSQPAVFDILILNGTVIDGTGRPGAKADVGIRKGRIAAIGNLAKDSAHRRIDAAGMAVTPGFIDVHTHIEDPIRLSKRRMLANNFVLQGVTTVITGNCGRSAPDIPALFQKLQHLKLAINVATLVGHNTLRQRFCPGSKAVPSPAQMHLMEEAEAKALEAGAVGFSTGLCYRPGVYTKQAEVVDLVKVCARLGGAYATHIRDEASGGMAALHEAVTTAQEAGVARLHISHLKAAGKSQWGTALARWNYLEHADSPTLHITTDMYPYTSLSSTLEYFVPEDAARLWQSPQTRDKAVDAILAKLHQDGWQGFGFVRIAFCTQHKEWIGLTLPEVVSKVTGNAKTSTADQARWILQNQTRGIQVIAQEMDEADVRALMRIPEMAFGSDSSVHYEGLGRPHPRGAGTFPRVFAEYVRGLHLLTLEEAVHRATGLPAQIFSLPERGELKEGDWADVVVFDPQRIQDLATFDDPWKPPAGIAYVIENGEVVAHNNHLTGALPGMPVRRAR